MEARALPTDTSLEALFGPALDHAYLQGAHGPPAVQGPGFSALEAWWMAELALLSYVPEREWVEGVCLRAGLERPRFFERGGTHAFRTGDRVVFRGTDDLEDFLRDLDAARSPEGAGRVHRGFQRSLDLIWEELEEDLEGRTVAFAGHSLGGALALLAAARHRSTRSVFTFGAPRVGDAAFGATVSAPVWRVVNNNDLVACLPPPVGFRHVGELHYFDNDGRLHVEPGPRLKLQEQLRGHGTRAAENVRRWLAGDFQAVPYDSLVDHSPRHYALHLWNHLAREAGSQGGEG